MTRLLLIVALLFTQISTYAQQRGSFPVLAGDSAAARLVRTDSLIGIRGHFVGFATVQPVLTRVAGVQYTPYSGAAGAGAVVRIRGAASMDTHALPLYVVDDVPMFQHRFDEAVGANGVPGRSAFHDASTNPLLSIAPEDIEQVEVLKGAFETGQYGFVGQNGIVRIRTRRGAAGQPLRVQYTGLGGVQTTRRRYDLLGAREAAELANEAARASGGRVAYTSAQLASFEAGTDWQSEVLRTAATQEHHLSLGGSNAHGTRYHVAFNYLTRQGVVLNTNLHRYGLRLNLDQKVGRRLFLSGGLSYSQVAERRADAALIPETLSFMPTVPVYAANGSYAHDNRNRNRNPVQIANQDLHTVRNRRLLARAALRYEIAKGFFLDLRASLERDSLRGRYYQGPFNDYALRDGFETNVRNDFYQQLVLNPAISFARTLAGHHTLTAAVEANRWESRQVHSSIQYSLPSPPYNAPPLISGMSQSARGYSLMSYQLVAGYAYSGRYALQGSLRNDYSSLLSQTEQRQWLPAAQATWHAGQENWLHNRGRISTLDVWAGWGNTSNGANFASGHYFMYLLPNTLIHDFPNERTSQADVGLRLGLWHDRLTITATAYQRSTRTVRATGSFAGHLSNPDPAYITNRGAEFSVTGRWQRGRLSGSTSAAAAFNRNRYDIPSGSQALIRLPGPYFIATPGQALSSFSGYRYLGVDATGQPRFDGQAVGTLGTKQVLGSGLPRQLFNLTQEVHYSRFDLSVQLDGMFGYDVFDSNLSILDLPQGRFNATTRVRSRWTPANPNTDVPRAGSDSADPFRTPTTYTLQSGNHVRLSNVVFTAEVWRRATRSVAVFISGTNLLVLSGYRGYDPNVSGAEANPLQAGLDYGATPVPRTWQLGVRAIL